MPPFATRFPSGRTAETTLSGTLSVEQARELHDHLREALSDRPRWVLKDSGLEQLDLAVWQVLYTAARSRAEFVDRTATPVLVEFCRRLGLPAPEAWSDSASPDGRIS